MREGEKGKGRERELAEERERNSLWWRRETGGREMATSESSLSHQPVEAGPPADEREREGERERAGSRRHRLMRGAGKGGGGAGGWRRPSHHAALSLPARDRVTRMCPCARDSDGALAARLGIERSRSRWGAGARASGGGERRADERWRRPSPLSLIERWRRPCSVNFN
jgi:hypothetical protein